MPEKTFVEKLVDTVGRIGLFAATLGLVSSVITLFGYELRLLMWIELMGPMMAWVFRGLLIVGGVGVFFVTSLLDKSQSPEALAAVAQAAQQHRAALEAHPKVQQLLTDLAHTMRVSFQETGDPDTYIVRRVTWSDPSGAWLLPNTTTDYTPDDPRVTSMAFYLERANAPQRIVVGQMFATRQITQADAHPAGWQMMVGT